MNAQKFADRPITSKLRHLQAVTVGLALVFTLLVSSVTEFWKERSQILADAASTGEMIGFNAAAALLFNDKRSATDILAALYSKPAIIGAQLYTLKGAAFAHYLANKPDHQWLAFPNALPGDGDPPQQNRIIALSHAVLQPVNLNGETTGYLYLVIDLQPMWWKLFINLGRISLVMLAAFLLSVFYGQHLAAIISEPLIRLSLLAQQVSQEKNYTLRATGEGEDEIGRLVKSFNRMIAQIEERDARLEQHRARLEGEVELRTADLRHSVAEAQAASIAKSQFLANMSHEIRTPMNSVLGMTELLLGTELNPSQRQYAEAVFRSADSLLSIINNILDFSKIEAGKLELEDIDFSLTRLLDQLIALFFEPARSKHIELCCNIDPGVPDAVRGDAYRLRQILTNLIANAIKFTDAGSIKLEVSTIATEACGLTGDIYLDFRVSDTGIGIAADALSKLFQSFSQADGSTTRKYGGTGLGLAICRELSELMGGTIGVESKPDTGTVFSVRLPLRKALAPIPAETRQDTGQLLKPGFLETAHLGDHDTCLRGKRILLAEDNPVNQEMAKAMLTMLGCRVDVAVNGLEALKIFKHGGHDLILMDCMMPEMDGYTSAREIRLLEKAAGKGRIPIVALTANAMQDDRKRCLAAGMSDYLAKPVLLEALRDKLITALKPASAEVTALAGNLSPPITGTARFDPAPLNLLYHMGGETLVSNVLELFRRNAAQQIDKLREGLLKQNSDTVSQAAHSLKSAAANIGGLYLAELARDIEQAARDGSLVFDEHFADSLKTEYQHILQIVSKQELS
ncbi:MAG: response regulator [Methylovulum sp.]|nr:MAG: response regulator [Methylovulum sp.]